MNEPRPAGVTAGLEEHVVEAFTAAGLPVPDRARVDREGYTREEADLIVRYNAPVGRRRFSADHPDRRAGDLGFREAARSGRPISQRPSPGEVSRVRAALVGHIPGRVGLTESELRAFARGDVERGDLPAVAQDRFRELATALGGGAFWPRKIATILWGMHAEHARSEL